MGQDYSSLTTLWMQQPGAEGGLFGTIVMVGGMVAIFYFLVFRPQKKKEKERKKLIESLTKGDRIITNGGLYATVVGVKEDIITAKISEDVKVEIDKTFIFTVVEKEAKK